MILVTGYAGGAVARALLEGGKDVRALARSELARGSAAAPRDRRGSRGLAAAVATAALASGWLGTGAPGKAPDAADAPAIRPVRRRGRRPPGAR